jgi:hypothetical protein
MRGKGDSISGGERSSTPTSGAVGRGGSAGGTLRLVIPKASHGSSMSNGRLEEVIKSIEERGSRYW